jgi:hypothetical protein
MNVDGVVFPIAGCLWADRRVLSLPVPPCWILLGAFAGLKVTPAVVTG